MSASTSTSSSSDEPFLYKLGFEVPRDVVRVIVHPSVKSIPRGVFTWCHSLKEVTLPEGLEEIGVGAFMVCTSLVHINYPSTLVRIGRDAFYECRSLLMTTTEEDEEVAVMMLPDGLREIGVDAFYGCESLTSIDCYSTLIKIDEGSFEGCTSLTKFTLMVGGIMTIEARAFGNCRSLEGVTILPSNKALVVVEVASDDDGELFNNNNNNNNNIRLVNGGSGTVVVANVAEQQQQQRAFIIISPPHLNSIRVSDLTGVANAIGAIMNDDTNNNNGGVRGRASEERIARVGALIRYRAAVEILTITELALWKNKMDEKIDSDFGTSRVACHVMCGASVIVPGVLSFL